MEKVTFTTSDGVKIVGDWHEAEGDRFALLLHMMPATKESWKSFAEALNKEGISCLAIDERGHGESVETESGETLDFEKIEDHSVKDLDVAASLEWLKEKSVALDKLAVVGASVGANLTIRALARHSEIRVGVALSPRIDARGTTASDAMGEIKDNQKVLLCSSTEDDPASFSAINELHELNRDHSFRIVLENAGHGTTMFESDPEFMRQVVEWISKSL